MDTNFKYMNKNKLFHCTSLPYVAIAAKQIDQFDIWQKITN